MSFKLVTLDYGTLSQKASKQVKVLVQTWWPKFNSCKPHSRGKKQLPQAVLRPPHVPFLNRHARMHVVKHGHIHTQDKRNKTKTKPQLQSKDFLKKGLREGWNKSGLVMLWTLLLSEHRGVRVGSSAPPVWFLWLWQTSWPEETWGGKGFILQLTGQESESRN